MGQPTARMIPPPSEPSAFAPTPKAASANQPLRRRARLPRPGKSLAVAEGGERLARRGRRGRLGGGGGASLRQSVRRAPSRSKPKACSRDGASRTLGGSVEILEPRQRFENLNGARQREHSVYSQVVGAPSKQGKIERTTLA